MDHAGAADISDNQRTIIRTFECSYRDYGRRKADKRLLENVLETFRAEGPESEQPRVNQEGGAENGPRADIQEKSENGNPNQYDPNDYDGRNRIR
jgi:hypothetical protein